MDLGPRGLHIDKYHLRIVNIRDIQKYILICKIMQNKILLTTGKQIGYVFQEKRFNNKLNKALANCLVLMCKLTHFHYSTKSCQAILKMLMCIFLNKFLLLSFHTGTLRSYRLGQSVIKVVSPCVSANC